ncbi:MAG: transmembrane 9 family protein [Promethearchaeia archaeon]
MRTNAHTQDYRWWWRSMFTGGSAAIYMFAYACFHYFSRAHPTAKFDLLASSIYFGTPTSVRTSQHV